MQKLISVGKRVVAITLLNGFLAMFVGGVIGFVLDCTNQDIVLECTAIIFIFLTAFVSAISLVYLVRPTLWNNIHKRRNHCVFLRLIPDIYNIIDFYFGFADYFWMDESDFWKDKSDFWKDESKLE